MLTYFVYAPRANDPCGLAGRAFLNSPHSSPEQQQIRLVVEYDGTRYHGWQAQPRVPTIQGVIEDSLQRILQQHTPVTAAGRTDAGVHAVAQVASFRIDAARSHRDWRSVLNRLLPSDVSIRSAERVGNDFHPRFSAKTKRYEYRILNRRERSGLAWNRAWHIWRDLSVQNMQEAAKQFYGTHDFTSFRCMPTQTQDTLCTVMFCDVTREDDDIVVTVEANRFLKQMVRVMVGTCVDVGAGRIPVLSIFDILEARDRCRAGRTAPPHGLYLMNVTYDGWCSGG